MKIKNKSPLDKNIRIKHLDEFNEKVEIILNDKTWLKGYRTNNFTTFTKDKNEFLKNIIEILTIIFPTTYQEWGKGRNHFHPIDPNSSNSSKTAWNIYIKVIKELYFKNTDIQQLNDLNLYQLGVSGSVRVICSKSGNKLKPLLIDHHHLGFANQKYNDKDFKNYNYCPIESK